MLHASTKRLIDTLGDRTRQKKVDWTESEDGSVVHDTEGYRVQITTEPHTIILLDALGKELDKVEPDAYGEALDSDGRPYGQFVSELFREAHRHARGTERAIEALLAGLDEDDGGPTSESHEIDTVDPAGDDDELSTSEDIESDLVPDDDDEVVASASLPEDTVELAEARPPMMGIGAAAAEAAEFEPAEASVTADEAFAEETHSDAAAEDGWQNGVETETHEDDPAPTYGSADEDFDAGAADVEEPLDITAPADPGSDASMPAADTGTNGNPFMETPKSTQVFPNQFGAVTEFTREETSEPESTPETDEAFSEAVAGNSDNVDLNEIEESISDAVSRLSGFAPEDVSSEEDVSQPDELAATDVAAEPQGFSLSGIGAGFGLGAAKANIADDLEEETEDAAEQVEEVLQTSTDFIDGTEDLPDDVSDMIDPDSPSTPLADAGDTVDEAPRSLIDQIDDADDATDEDEGKSGTAREAVAGVFSGFLGGARSTASDVADTVEDAVEAVSEETQKVVDDIGESEPKPSPEKRKTSRFNPWN